MSKILVTGATGFIGRFLCQKLQEEGYEVLALASADGDVADRRTWKDLVSVNHVFHLASQTFVPDSWNDPHSFIKSNVIGTQNALDYSLGCGAGLTYVSGYLYGLPEVLPVPESANLKPNNPYALSKCLAEELCSFYRRYFQIPVNVIRPFNVYGVGQSRDFLVPIIINQALNSDEIILRDLLPKRDYVYIDDVICSLIKTLSVDGGVYNIASGESHSVKEVAELVNEIIGRNLNIKSLNEIRFHEVDETVADIAKAKKDLDWSPRIGLKEGLIRTIEGYKS